MRRHAVLVIAAVCALSAQPAHARLIVGMGDQKSSMFSDPNFQRLGLRYARIVVPYDDLAANKFDRTDAWMNAAKSAGITPLVAIEHGAHVLWLPSVKTYTRAVRHLRARYPWARTLSAWNEANHQGQPTWRHPKRAAQYYNAMRSVCPKCTIVAADVRDAGGLERWLRIFKKTAKHPRIWGLHNYVDVNRCSGPPSRSSTAWFARSVRGEVWVTETGGLVHFRTDFRGGALAETHAAQATKRAFALARSNPRIKRLYLYHWSASAVFQNWDSAFVDSDGRLRPAYQVLRRELRASPTASTAQPASTRPRCR
jgi:hypothetical protein